MERSDPFAPIGFGSDFLGGYTLAYVTRDSSGERVAPDESFYPWKPRPAYDGGKIDPFMGPLMEGRSSILMEVPSGAPEKMLSGDSQMMDFAMGEQGQPKIDPFMRTGDATLSNVDLPAQNGPSAGAPSDSVHWLYFKDGDWIWEIRVKDGNAYIIPVEYTEKNEVVVVAKPDAHAPYSPGASVDPSGNASVDTEQTRNRSSAGDRALDETNESNANVQRAVDKGEPIQVPSVDVSQLLRDLNGIFKQHEAARILAAGVREAADEAEARNQEEKALRADLPGQLGSVIPIYGSVQSSRGQIKHGNYGRGLFYGALAISDVFLVKSIAVGGGKVVLRGIEALFGSVAERGLPRQLGTLAAADFEGGRRVFGEYQWGANVSPAGANKKVYWGLPLSPVPPELAIPRIDTPRVLARAAEVGPLDLGHNFPVQLDQLILEGPRYLRFGRRLNQAPSLTYWGAGSLPSGATGTFEIGVLEGESLFSEEIIHRAFSPKTPNLP
jgi:hypothetical protein